MAEAAPVDADRRRVGASRVVLLLLLAEDSARGGRSLATVIIEVVLLGIVLVMGLVKWLVTRWALDGSTLRIETGLFRRDARQLPLSRIQAVDVVRPFLARVFGLAELRVRLAGSGRSNGRLAYLAEPVAVDLRARLLAGHHGLDLATPEPAERPVATVPVNQLGHRSCTYAGVLRGRAAGGRHHRPAGDFPGCGGGDGWLFRGLSHWLRQADLAPRCGPVRFRRRRGS